MFALSYGEEMRTGVERCCQQTGDSCFLVDNGDRFALVHFTGESDYIVDRKWVESDRGHVANSALQTLLLSSSCDVLVDMVQVS